MKFLSAKLLSILVAFLISTSAVAQVGRRAAHELKGTPESLTLGQIGQLFSHRAAIRPSAVITESGVSSYVFPVAINSPGKNGTFFKTDAVISNNRSIPQDILVLWLPAGSSAVGAGVRYTLDALTVYFLQDFLGSDAGDLNRSGVGALLITGVFSGSTTEDTDANLDGAIRNHMN